MGLLAVLALYCVGTLAVEGLSQVPQLTIPQAGSASLGVDLSWGPTGTSETARLTTVTATNTATITTNTAAVTTGGTAQKSTLSTVGDSGKTGSFTHLASITTMSWQPALSSHIGTASGIKYMPTGNINMPPKYPNSSVSVATGIIWSGSSTHSLVPGTAMDPGFRSTASGGLMALSIITSHEIATSAVQFVTSSGQSYPTSLKSSNDATQVATTASVISSTLASSSNNSTGASQITFKGVGQSLHFDIPFCVLAVVMGLVYGL